MSPQAQIARRLKVLVGLVCAGGIAVAVFALVRLVRSPLDSHEIVALAALLTLAMIADYYPVPIDGIDIQGYSLSTVFVTGGIVLFGWEPLVVVCLLGVLIVNVFERRPLIRVAYNAAVAALSALAGGLLASSLPSSGRLVEVVGAVALVAIGYGGLNLILISAAVALSNAERIRLTYRKTAAWIALPAALGASASLMLVVLWQRSPFLVFALAGPLIAIALYERQKNKALSAMQLAFTDPLTGLGNTRHFHERLQRSLDEAESSDQPLALCVFDLDNLKEVNDEFGHPAGDRVLIAVAGRLRHGGEAFRLGGDEFAVLLPGHRDDEAVTVATTILERIASLKVGDLPSLTMSCGLAVFPYEGVSRQELLRLADSALYWAKDHGKNRVRVYHTEALSAYQLERLGSNPDLSTRLRAAASLADAVDARDAHAGAHSRRVGDLAARLGKRLGADDDEVELLRLAGHLHDVGKLAIPEELLRKRGPITDSERVVLQRHPQIGFRMLEGLALGPVADWVLHHHERWDGTGYPTGQAGERIPLGARIIFVADAWDSMTSERTYKAALGFERALVELESRAGSQFDPSVVQALAIELGLITIPEHTGELSRFV